MWFMVQVDLGVWIGIRGTLGALVRVRGCKYVGVDTWVWIRGCGCIGLGAWMWMRGCGYVDVDAWCE